MTLQNNIEKRAISQKNIFEQNIIIYTPPQQIACFTLNQLRLYQEVSPVGLEHHRYRSCRVRDHRRGQAYKENVVLYGLMGGFNFFFIAVSYDSIGILPRTENYLLSYIYIYLLVGGLIILNYLSLIFHQQILTLVTRLKPDETTRSYFRLHPFITVFRKLYSYM